MPLKAEHACITKTNEQQKVPETGVLNELYRKIKT